MAEPHATKLICTSEAVLTLPALKFIAYFKTNLTALSIKPYRDDPLSLHIYITCIYE